MHRRHHGVVKRFRPLTCMTDATLMQGAAQRNRPLCCLPAPRTSRVITPYSVYLCSSIVVWMYVATRGYGIHEGPLRISLTNSIKRGPEDARLLQAAGSDPPSRLQGGQHRGRLLGRARLFGRNATPDHSRPPARRPLLRRPRPSDAPSPESTQRHWYI